jgi:hypothetical protein
VVYVVKDNVMTADAVDVHEAPMLDCTASATSTAFLLFIGESTAGKDAALKWVLEKIVTPFVADLRVREHKETSSCAALLIDGDPRQLQVVSADSTRAVFEAGNILVGKSLASCTPLYQPLDAGHVFLAAKTRFRSMMHESGGAQQSDQETRNLLEIFRQHRRNYPRKLKQNKKPSEAMGKYFKDVMVSLHTAAAALRDSATGSSIKKSFAVCGVSVRNPAVIRDRSRYAWTQAEAEQFVAAVPALSNVFGEQSEVKDADFDALNFPDNNVRRDTLPVYRRRALLVHATHVLTQLQDAAARGEK